MKITKKTFFKIHSWIGVHLSILFFIVCFSGTLATLSQEMDWLFNAASRAVPQQELASRNDIVANFHGTYPNASLGYWMRADEPYLCDIIYKKENGATTYVFANPYTGKIQGETQLTFQRYFRDLHYFLFIPFQVGNYTVLLFAFLLLISMVTALCFYKKWWRKLFELQIGKGSLVLFRSLHRLVGVWSVPFMLLISITGIWYFLERANVGDINDKGNPDAPEVHYTKAEADMLRDRSVLDIDYDRAVTEAKQAIPGLNAGTMSVTDDYIYVTGKSNEPLVRQRANRVYVDLVNYQPLHVQKAGEISTVMWINDVADPLHFGSWGGLATKIVWFIFGLGICSLILTGIWISLKRKALKRKNARTKIMGGWRYVNWGIYMVMLVFMYYRLKDDYRVSGTTIMLITLCWLLFVALVYYIFVYRLNRSIGKVSQRAG